jgi:hypothetical protein
MLADSYPLLDVIWTMLVFFLWVAWFFLLIKIIGDVFRRHDVGGVHKAIWLIFLLFVPFLGAFAYLIVNSEGMAKREMERAQAAQQQFDSYVQSAAGSSGPAGEIDKAKKLLDSGAISQAEYDAIKAKALAS